MRMLRDWRERTVTMFVNYREDNNGIICDAYNTFFNHYNNNGENCSDNSVVISDDNSDF